MFFIYMRPFYLSTYLLHSHKTYIPLKTSWKNLWWMERKSCPFFSNPSCIELKVWNLKFLFPLPKFSSLLPSLCSQELHKLWMKLITKKKLSIYGSHEMLPHKMNYVGVEFSIQTNCVYGDKVLHTFNFNHIGKLMTSQIVIMDQICCTMCVWPYGCIELHRWTLTRWIQLNFKNGIEYWPQGSHEIDGRN